MTPAEFLTAQKKAIPKLLEVVAGETISQADLAEILLAFNLRVVSGKQFANTSQVRAFCLSAFSYYITELFITRNVGLDLTEVATNAPNKFPHLEAIP